MLTKICNAVFIVGHAGAAIASLMAIDLVLAYGCGIVLELATRIVPRWHYSVSTWTLICFAIFMVVVGLMTAAPALAGVLGDALHTSLYGAGISAIAGHFLGLPWPQAAAYGGGFFFILCVLKAMTTRQTAPQMQTPDIFGIGVDEASNQRLKDAGIL